MNSLAYPTNTLNNYHGLLNSFDASELANLSISIGQVSAKKFGFNINDNQNYNTIIVTSFLEMIDPSIDVSLQRNGADFEVVRKGVIIRGEMKASNLHNKTNPSSPKKTGGWCFHGHAVVKNGHEELFVFYTHLQGIPKNIYYISEESKVKAVNEFLMQKSLEWQDKVFSGKHSGKNDQITISENFVKQLFDNHKGVSLVHDGIEVTAYID